MDNLTIINQGASTSIFFIKQGIGGGVFQGVVPNVRNHPTTTKETNQILEISQMNRTIQQMKIELTRLGRDQKFIPDDKNPRFTA
jgi:hypothetical protein